MVSLSKYYLIITMVTATPEFGTDMFIFHQENNSREQCLESLNANPDKYLFITRKVIPRLLDKGVSQEVINTVMVDNPRRYFEGIR